MRLLFLTLLFSAIGGAAFANTGPADPDKLDLSIGVKAGDTHLPLRDVVVSVVSHQTKEKKQVTTSADGSYYFDNLKTGNYKVIFEKDGYKSLIKDTVFIREDENFQISVELTKSEPFRLIPGILMFE
ncbi:MAG: carboxypeptidase-like regulatory domain-containing protein [Flavisolibacter sp.]